MFTKNMQGILQSINRYNAFEQFQKISTLLFYGYLFPHDGSINFVHLIMESL